MGSVSNAVERAEERRAPTLRDAIKRSEGQFANALPSHVDAKRFLRAALTAINTVPKLAECTEASVLAGLMQAAQLGLEVSDVRGQCYLIPRGGLASFELGYRGMIDLAARAGITVDVDTIYENDHYEFQRGTDSRLDHVPTLGTPGKPVAYYAVAHFNDGRRPQFLIRSRLQIEEHRDKFATNKKVWSEHFNAMAHKTVIKALLNKLPTSAEVLQRGLAADTAEVATYVPMEPVEQPYGAIDTTTGEITRTEPKPLVGPRDAEPMPEET